MACSIYFLLSDHIISISPLVLSESSLRHRLAGLSILAMVVVIVLKGLISPVEFIDDDLSQALLVIAGSLGWFAALLLLADTRATLQIQVGLISLIGICLAGYAFNQGASIDIGKAVGGNSGLLTMIAAVGFLRLVALPDANKNEPLPVGRKAYLQTLLGINITSSVINISSPILISDRIHQHRPLTRFSAQSIVRVFCGVSSWSPFFGAMAVVLTYVEGAQVLSILKVGLPFTVAGFIVVYVEAQLRYSKQLDEFVGYPFHLNALKIPAVLMVSVVLLSRWLPEVPVLVVISICALVVTAVTLILRRGLVACWQSLHGYVYDGLPKIANELLLFQAAGLLAAGMVAVMQLGIVDNPFSAFDSTTAAQILGVILLAGAVGVHPVILISSLSPLIMGLNPNPSFLAATYLLAWNLGTCANPLSGTQLVFQGRYGIPGWQGAISNWPYAVLMYLVAVVWLWISEGLFF